MGSSFDACISCSSVHTQWCLECNATACLTCSEGKTLYEGKCYDCGTLFEGSVICDGTGPVQCELGFYLHTDD